MAFPTAPANNAKHEVAGIEYTYNAATMTWQREPPSLVFADATRPSPVPEKAVWVETSAHRPVMQVHTGNKWQVLAGDIQCLESSPIQFVLNARDTPAGLHIFDNLRMNMAFTPSSGPKEMWFAPVNEAGGIIPVMHKGAWAWWGGQGMRQTVTEKNGYLLLKGVNHSKAGWASAGTIYISGNRQVAGRHLAPSIGWELMGVAQSGDPVRTAGYAMLARDTSVDQIKMWVDDTCNITVSMQGWGTAL